jgi:hypothetical protein
VTVAEELPTPSPGLGELGGRYALVRELGAGGMGRVYLAHDKALQRDVAVKVLRDTFDDPRAIARFEQEARAAGSLNHPNVLTIFDIGWEDGQPFIVSELLEGKTLKRVLLAGPLDPLEATALALQLASGLSAAHARGIVHRDIKPANLFVVGGERLKILDFGVAKLLQGDAAEHALTDTGQSVGTVLYMSPEQVRALPVTDRSDVFSFGLVLHELLSGRRAFVRASPVETAHAITVDEPEPLPGGLPVRLVKLVAACLHKQPQKRPSIEAVLAGLQAVAGATTLTLTPLSVARPKRGGLAGVFASPLARATTAAVAAVLLLAALAWFGRALGPREVRAPLEGTVAVLPFTPAPGAEAAWLGEGLVDLLSDGLGAAQVRTVAPRRSVEAARQEKDPRAAARRLGAAGYLTGAVKGGKDGPLRLTLELRDSADGWLRLGTSVEGDPRQPMALVGEVVSRLLPLLAKAAPGAGGAGATAASYSRVPAALQAFLEGEALFRRSRWADSAAAYQRAAAADPDFALAHYRLAVTTLGSQPGLAQDALARALAARGRLTPAELALVEAFADLVEGRVFSAEKAYRAILAVRPEDIEANFQLGEVLFHWNPVRGRPAAEATERFSETVLLDPSHGAALGHLIDLAQLGGSKALALTLANRYLDAAEGDAKGSLLEIRWVRAWASGDAAARAPLLEELRRTPAEWPQLLFRAHWEQDGLVSAREVAETIRAAAEDDVHRSYPLFSLATIDFAQGRPAAARARMAQVMKLSNDGAMRYYAAWMESRELSLATPAQLADARTLLASAEFTRSPAVEPFRHHLDGLLALRLSDFAGAEKDVATLEATPHTPGSLALDLARGLRAEIAFARGQVDQAWQELDAVRLQVPFRRVSFYSHVAPRHLRARLLLRRGQVKEALELFALADFWDLLGTIQHTEMLLATAPLLEQTGDRAGAAQQYRELALLLRDAEPPLRPRLEQALAAAARLGVDPPGAPAGASP